MANVRVPSGGNYSDADWLTNFRFWLISLLAGKSVVVLNARVESRDRPGVGFKDIDGLFVKGCDFHVQLNITQRSKETTND